MRPINWLKLIFSIVICESAGILGSLFTFSQVKTWYKDLIKPSFNPPSWVFGPVWTILFLLMGIAFYLAWENNFLPKAENKAKAWNLLSEKLYSGSLKGFNVIAIFVVQLILNVLWSIIFFGLHLPGLAFFELLMLWFSILYTIINFYRVSKLAGLILLPYILWVSFAGFLNYFIWILNI
jgi:tryptophan-rich sensory protein